MQITNTTHQNLVYRQPWKQKHLNPTTKTFTQIFDVITLIFSFLKYKDLLNIGWTNKECFKARLIVIQDILERPAGETAPIKFRGDMLATFNFLKNPIITKNFGDPNLTKINYLDISQSELPAEVITFVPFATKIKASNLFTTLVVQESTNFFTGVKEDFWQMKERPLTHLDISDNDLNSYDIDCLARASVFGNLKVLKLGAGQPTEHSSEWGALINLVTNSPFPHLEEIDLSGYGLENDIVTAIVNSNMKNLKYVDLSWALIDDGGIEILIEGAHKLQNIREINLDLSNVSEEGIFELMTCQKFPNLRFVSFLEIGIDNPYQLWLLENNQAIRCSTIAAQASLLEHNFDSDPPLDFHPDYKPRDESDRPEFFLGNWNRDAEEPEFKYKKKLGLLMEEVILS